MRLNLPLGGQLSFNGIIEDNVVFFQKIAKRTVQSIAALTLAKPQGIADSIGLRNPVMQGHRQLQTSLVNRGKIDASQ